MNSVLDTIEGWVARGDRVAVATVVETKKSAPQPEALPTPYTMGYEDGHQ